MILGGPGEAASANTGAAAYDFGAARARHDIVLVDYRGEGRSDPIDCSALQHLQTDSADDVIAAAGVCGTQLGDASDRYGAADVADDIDAVRAALGYPRIDLDGLSYGTVQAQAYALRHRQHAAPTHPAAPPPTITTLNAGCSAMTPSLRCLRADRSSFARGART